MLLSKAKSSTCGLHSIPSFKDTGPAFIPFSLHLNRFLPFLEHSLQHKKHAATSPILKKIRCLNSTSPTNLLPPFFAPFSAKLVERVVYTHYLQLVSCFLFSPVQSGFAPSPPHQNSISRVTDDLMAKAKTQSPVFISLGRSAAFNSCPLLPPPYPLFICLPADHSRVSSCLPVSSFSVSLEDSSSSPDLSVLRKPGLSPAPLSFSPTFSPLVIPKDHSFMAPTC